MNLYFVYNNDKIEYIWERVDKSEALNMYNNEEELYCVDKEFGTESLISSMDDLEEAKGPDYEVCKEVDLKKVLGYFYLQGINHNIESSIQFKDLIDNDK